VQKDDLINTLTATIHNFTDRIKAIENMASQEAIQSLASNWNDELEKSRPKSR